MKEFTSIQKASLKRTMANVYQYVEKVNKLNAQIEKLNEQKEEYKTMIEMIDAPTLHMTGYHSIDLFDKTKDPKTNQTRFVFKYPETIVPISEELQELPEKVIIDIPEDNNTNIEVFDNSMETETVNSEDSEYNF